MSTPWRSLALLAFVATAVVPAGPAKVLAEPAEPAPTWVKTSDDSVISADIFEAMRADSSGQYQAVTNGDGFYSVGRNSAEFTIRLVTSSEGNIETYRAKLQQTANQINALSGMVVQVAAGTVPGPPNPLNIDPPDGEIYVVISSSSGCGTLSGGTLGCGGPRGGDYIDGSFRSTSGVVWLSPTMQTKCQQPVTSHEVGHALGLAHYDAKYLGVSQVMKSATNCVFPIDYQAGDVNGLRYVGEGTIANDSVAAAELVCPYHDTTVTASTWFASKESGEPAHAGAGPHRSVWYQFTPLIAGATTIKTQNTSPASFDTVLAVYKGTMFGGVVPVASNDNDVGTNSKVTFPADAGTTYFIAVDGVGVSRGETDVAFDILSAPLPTIAPGVPIRLMDSRRGGQTVDCYDQGVGRSYPGAIYELQVRNRSWVGNATSVVLNVTAVSPSKRGFVTVYPCDSAVPNASNLNFAAGDVIPNLVISKVGSSGTVCFSTSQETDLIVDISGQFIGTSVFTPLSTPARLLDTRTGGATVDGQHAGVGRIAAGVPYQLPVATRTAAGWSPANPTTVVLNVTAVNPSGRGYLTVYPCDAPQIPNASNLNFLAGDVIPNLVIAKVGTGGLVCFVSSVATDLLVDASGQFLPASTFNALTTPGRLLDTRSGGATVDGLHAGVGRIAAGTTYTLPVGGRTTNPVMPANPATVVLNVTAVAPSAQGFLTVFPCDQPRPNASNLNFLTGDVIPNSVLAKVSAAGTVCFYSSVQTDLLVDVSGYLTS